AILRTDSAMGGTRSARGTSRRRGDTEPNGGPRRPLGEFAVLEDGPPVRGNGRDDVAHPAEQAAGANPHAGRDDEPEDAAEEVSVVNLPDPGNEHAQNGGDAGTTVRPGHRS